MKALRNFSYATGRTLREPRRTAPTSSYREQVRRQHPSPRRDSARRASCRWVVMRALRIAAEALFVLWVLAALSFCTAVVVALMR